jgi:HK97 family phage prohead protease
MDTKEGKFNFRLDKKESDDDVFRVAGYLSTFGNADREGDYVDPEAFKKTVKDIKKNRGGMLPMLINHTSNTKSQAGAFDKFKVDENGLYVEGYIVESNETEHERRLIKAGALNTFSMGGLFTYERDDKNRLIIKEVDLLEGSIVTIPANPKAQFVKKAFEIEDVEESQEEIESEEAKEFTTEQKIQMAKDILKMKGIL